MNIIYLLSAVTGLRGANSFLPVVYYWYFKLVAEKNYENI